MRSIVTKLVLAFALSFLFGGMAAAKPGFVKGAKCIACHTEAMGKKTNVSEKSQAMAKEQAGKKCSDCHTAGAEGKSLLCEGGKACKK